VFVEYRAEDPQVPIKALHKMSEAQAKFHRFYFALAEAVADADEAPEWLPDSPHRLRVAN
jgi:hypothetical protein